MIICLRIILAKFFRSSLFIPLAPLAPWSNSIFVVFLEHLSALPAWLREITATPILPSMQKLDQER
jgi:hypothetical protein